jgi:hypothetical protein
MNGSVEDLEAKSGYLNSGFSTNQLFTSLLRAFGGDDAGFGYSDETTPTGGSSWAIGRLIFAVSSNMLRCSNVNNLGTFISGGP